MMKRKMTKRSILAVLMIALLLMATVSGTVAYLIDRTEDVENVFQPSRVPSEVEEKFNGTKKEEVKIRNNGNVPAYIRAAVVVTWKNADGEIYPAAPERNKDYEMVDGTAWNNGRDGYYYYPSPVAAGGVTLPLIVSCTANDTVPVDYFLNVEVIGQAIQAEGVNEEGKHPVALAWGVTVNNNQTPDDFSDDTISK